MQHATARSFGHASPPPPPQPTREDVADLVALARTYAGLTLSESKIEFVAGRLGRRLAAHGLPDYAAYRRLLRSDPAERATFTEALTTHTTSFFRERAQYDWLLEDGLPELHASGALSGRELVVWSAACSSGQEGYTALMVAALAREKGLWDLAARLVGTDISRAVLRLAAQAVYSTQEVEGIPRDVRPKFLLSSRSGDGRHRIVPDLRRRASWRQANLAEAQGLHGIAADVVFLRNVLIYFDEEMREAVMANVVERLRPGGFLLIGHTEAQQGRRDGLEMIRPSIYRRVR